MFNNNPAPSWRYKNLYLSMERLRRRSTVDLYWNTVLWSEKLIWSTLAWLPTGTAHCTCLLCVSIL